MQVLAVGSVLEYLGVDEAHLRTDHEVGLVEGVVLGHDVVHLVELPLLEALDHSVFILVEIQLIVAFVLATDLI